MAFAMASVRSTGPIVVEDVANVSTSFPAFPAACSQIGLSVEEVAVP